MNYDQAKRCVVTANDNLDPSRSIVPVSETNRSLLNSRQIDDYEKHRFEFLSWLLNVGKKPSEVRGYSPYAVYMDSQRAAAFDRWMWEPGGTSSH